MSNHEKTSVTLVFPAVGHAAAEYLRSARLRGEHVVCAASVPNDEFVSEFGWLQRLPFIHDDDFESVFFALVEGHSISRLFCPVSTVYAFMNQFISARGLDIQLVGFSPVRQQMELHRQLMARATRLLTLVELCAAGAPALSLREVAGVLRQASLIYGESNDDKLAAMMGIFAAAPKGDVVEIGSLMGRSAFVLLYLARRHEVGSLLTIDPWSARECVQQQSPGALQWVTDEWDFEVLSEGFAVNFVPFGSGDHAHLRKPSNEAFPLYANGNAITSSEGAPVVYSGGISVIHIDGNHDYGCVKNDCLLWLDKMLPESWLILDDYVWTHGDGPYRTGNELLQDQSERIECAFVCGKALFVKFR